MQNLSHTELALEGLQKGLILAYRVGDIHARYWDGKEFIFRFFGPHDGFDRGLVGIEYMYETVSEKKTEYLYDDYCGVSFSHTREVAVAKREQVPIAWLIQCLQTALDNT